MAPMVNNASAASAVLVPQPIPAQPAQAQQQHQAPPVLAVQVSDYQTRLDSVNHIGHVTVIVVSILGIVGTLSASVIGIPNLGYWLFTAFTPAALDHKAGNAVDWKPVVEKVMVLAPLIFINCLGAFNLISPSILGWVNIGLIGFNYLFKGVSIYSCIKFENLNCLSKGAEAIRAVSVATQALSVAQPVAPGAQEKRA